VRRRSTLVRRSPHRSPLRPTAPRGCLVPPSACFLTTHRPLLAANGKRTTENLFWLSSFLGAKMGIVFGNIVGTRMQLLQCPHVAIYQFAKPFSYPIGVSIKSVGSRTISSYCSGATPPSLSLSSCVRS
jgi:hypothetical protein